jgi:predicted nucleotidyltransferase
MGHILRIMTQNRSFDIQRLSDALIRRIILLLSGGVLCYQAVMDREDIIGRLRENEAALRARGVAHAALFGSRARGDARPDSDTDIMIEIDPTARIGVWEYVGLKEYIASLFDGPVDVVNRDGLKPYVRPAATADAIYAF